MQPCEVNHVDPMRKTKGQNAYSEPGRRAGIIRTINSGKISQGHIRWARTVLCETGSRAQEVVGTEGACQRALILYDAAGESLEFMIRPPRTLVLNIPVHGISVLKQHSWRARVESMVSSPSSRQNKMATNANRRELDVAAMLNRS